MKVYYKILIKIVLLGFVLILFNYIYSVFFFEDDIQKHSETINQVREVVNQNCEVVYLGESSNTTFRDHDLDKRAISNFVEEYYPNIKFGHITKNASHAAVYYTLLKNIPQQSNVKTVIVTLNLRSFNANWIYSDLETPLQKGLVMLQDYPPLINRFLLSFKGYDHKSNIERKIQTQIKWRTDNFKFPYAFEHKNVIEWDDAMSKTGIKNIDGTINQKLTTLAGHYIKTYAFQIDTSTNPRIKDFDNIVKLAADRKWNLVFNLLAENTEKANTLVGKDLLYLIEYNRRLLIDRYNGKGVIVVDNLNDVDDIEFIDQDWTTEHYAENGRKIIAKNIADSLKSLYPEKYKEVVYNENSQTYFFNNCDSTVIWSSMHTVTTEKAYSGNRSSKTDGLKNVFSITLGYPMQRLTDDLDSIDIDFQIYATTATNNLNAAIEFSDKNSVQSWKGIPLESRITPGKWCRFSYTHPISAEEKKYDLIKIYVVNSSGTIVYIDDFGVKFH